MTALFKPRPPMHEEVFWRARLNVAFRTALGCFLTGLVLQLGGMHLHWFTFPIFAYVMAVTVVGESTFGKAFQDTVGVLIGTIQGCGMAMLVFQAVGADKITLGSAILWISLSSFIIVYPRNTLIISKRVALAHSAILYVTASIERGDMEVISFPLKLGGTTMVGAVSGMVALLLPFPHLAMFQVRSQLKLSTRVISERLRTIVDAFCVLDLVKGRSLNLQAQSLAKIGSSIDAEIVSKESDLGWELPGFSHNLMSLIKGLKRLKEHLVGMESALASDLSRPSSARALHYMLKDCLIYLTDWACLALRHSSENNRWKSWSHIHLIVDEGREAQDSFIEKLSTVRQKLACMASDDLEESFHGLDLVENRDADLDAGFKKAFQVSSPALFFLFNLEKFLEETEDILSTAMADKAPPKVVGKNGRMADADRHNNSSKSKKKGRYEQLRDMVELHIAATGVPHLPHYPKMVVEDPRPCKYCYSARGMPFQQQQQQEQQQQEDHSRPTMPTIWSFGIVRWRRWVEGRIDAQQARTAFKMSLAMAMGAFMGSWFSRDKGYWADITLGLGFTGVSKGGSFKSATLRAQGTVAGSIYGLLVVLATKNWSNLRMVALIPWLVLTSFLRRSKLYGYAGAVSAFTGAIVILAHTSDKDSSEEDFTVIRIVEAFLGMASFILVELLVMPSRATSLVKAELVPGLGKLKAHCAAALSVYSEPRCCKCCADAVADLKSREKTLKSLCARLTALVKEAAEEPRFWFSAFPETAYSKILHAMAKMLDHLHFSLCAFDAILDAFARAGMAHQGELQDALAPSMRVLDERLIPLLEFLEQALQGHIATKGDAEQLLDRSKIDGNGAAVAAASSGNNNNNNASSIIQFSFPRMDPPKPDFLMEDFEKIFHQLVARLRHCTCAASSISPPNMEDAYTNTFLLSLGTLAFSLEGLLTESTNLDKALHERLQLESPWSLIDLWDSSTYFTYRPKLG